MSGEILGILTSSMEVSPYSQFKHGCAHNFNLVLINVVSSKIHTNSRS